MKRNKDEEELDRLLKEKHLEQERLKLQIQKKKEIMEEKMRLQKEKDEDIRRLR